MFATQALQRNKIQQQQNHNVFLHTVTFIFEQFMHVNVCEVLLYALPSATMTFVLTNLKN